MSSIVILLKYFIILPSVLHECVTWTLTLREEHILKVFGNRLLRIIFEPETDDLIGSLRKLLNLDQILW
jgi:hypothetical protein